MPQILIVVHGMGVDKAGWAAPVVTQLNTVARRYDTFTTGPDLFVLATGPDDITTPVRPDQVLVVPVGYDAEMRAQVEKYQNDTQAIITGASAAGILLPSELVTVLGSFHGAGDTTKFFWSHAVDVLLYRYVITKQLRVVVMDGIAKVLQRPGVDVSLMAHSLGTSVAHDALSTLARGLDPALGALRPPGVRLVNVFMVANVSRLLSKALQGDADVYDSGVCPISVSGDDSYCGEFYDFRHSLDPFLLPVQFNPPWTGDDFHPVHGLSHVGNFNVHDWGHYLDHPRVHVPILNAFAMTLPDRTPVDAATAQAAAEAYEAAPILLCDAGMQFWNAEQQQIAARITATPTVPELIRTAVLFLAAVEAARKLCDLQAVLAGAPTGGTP